MYNKQSVDNFLANFVKLKTLTLEEDSNGFFTLPNNYIAVAISNVNYNNVNVSIKYVFSAPSRGTNIHNVKIYAWNENSTSTTYANKTLTFDLYYIEK